MYIPVYLILVMCMSSASKELKMISNIKTKIVRNVLYIFWNVNPGLHRNVSGPVKFEVKYCPLDMYLFPQDCQGVTVTLCKATYSRLPIISGNISTHEDELADYLGVHRILFLKNSSASISSEWNETTSQFMCAVHNVDECWVAYRGAFLREAAIKAQALINASTINYQEEELLDIKRNQLVLSKYLNQPRNIFLVQNGRKTVTVKWTTCPYDNPAGFNITFKGEGGEILKCGPVLNKEDFHHREWQHNCELPLRAYTIYTVSIYSYGGLNYNKRLMSRSLAGVKTFRTHEQAPSFPPTIECAVCQEDKFNDDYRIVIVRWKLPPKDTCNGLVRQSILEYWEKNDLENKTQVTYPSMTTDGQLKLKVNMDYSVKVKICTQKDLCSDFSKPKDILKVPEEDVMETSDGSKGLEPLTVFVIALPCVVVVVVVPLICFLYWRKQRKEARKQMIDPLETLSETIETDNESNKTKVNSGSPHSMESVYHELPEALEEDKRKD